MNFVRHGYDAGSSGSDFNTHDVVDLAAALRLGGINDDILTPDWSAS